MLSIIKTEFQKIKRYHILLIGIIGMALSPILSVITQSVSIEEAKIENFDFSALFNSTIWNNATIFMPIVFTLIGGYLINREYTDDTLKNIFVVPVSFRKLLAGKLFATALIVCILGCYSFFVSLIIGLLSDLKGISFLILIRGCLQMVGISICTYIVVLPIIAFSGRNPGYFMGGAVISFVLGYCSMFFKTGLLRNIYPFLASFTVICFDTTTFMNTVGTTSSILGIASLSFMFLLAVLIVFFSKKPGAIGEKKIQTGIGISLRPAQRDKLNGKLKGFDNER